MRFSKYLSKTWLLFNVSYIFWADKNKTNPVFFFSIKFYNLFSEVLILQTQSSFETSPRFSKNTFYSVLRQLTISGSVLVGHRHHDSRVQASLAIKWPWWIASGIVFIVSDGFVTANHSVMFAKLILATIAIYVQRVLLS